MAQTAASSPIEDDDVERLELEVAVAEAGVDPRPSVPHEFVRIRLQQEADRARRLATELANRHKRVG